MEKVEKTQPKGRKRLGSEEVIQPSKRRKGEKNEGKNLHPILRFRYQRSQKKLHEEGVDPEPDPSTSRRFGQPRELGGSGDPSPLITNRRHLDVVRGTQSMETPRTLSNKTSLLKIGEKMTKKIGVQSLQRLNKEKEIRGEEVTKTPRPRHGDEQSTWVNNPSEETENESDLDQDQCRGEAPKQELLPKRGVTEARAWRDSESSSKDLPDQLKKTFVQGNAKESILRTQEDSSHDKEDQEQSSRMAPEEGKAVCDSRKTWFIYNRNLTCYESPKEAWMTLQKTLKSSGIGNQLRIWDPFFCSGLAKTYMSKLGYNLIHDNTDFWAEIEEYNRDTIGRKCDVICTNPPFNEKKKIMAKLLEMEIPFALLLPVATVSSKFFNSFLVEKEIEYQVIVPKQRYNFHRTHDTKKTDAPFDTVWLLVRFSQLESLRETDNKPVDQPADEKKKKKGSTGELSLENPEHLSPSDFLFSRNQIFIFEKESTKERTERKPRRKKLY